jgi:hypothetical protein
MNWKNMTNEQVIAAWDNGDPVWTCEMGGMSPGYEQAIQLMGFEMLKAMIANPIDWPDVSGPENREKLQKYYAMIESDVAVEAIVEKVGSSGAQHSAAMNIASVFARKGYAAGMETVPEDRRILVSKNSLTF